MSVRFSKIDRKTGKVLSVYSAPFFEDNSCGGSSAWTSLDGKYGYVNYSLGDKLTTINLDSETIDNEISTRVHELSSFGSPVRVMADGTLFSSGVFVSNKGEVAATNERKEFSEHSYNADGSLTGMLSSQLDGEALRALSASASVLFRLSTPLRVRQNGNPHLARRIILTRRAFRLCQVMEHLL